MKYTIEFLEAKSPDWKIASLSGPGLTGIVTDVSINAKDKSGTPFPNFATMMTGHTVEGDFWTSSTGKKYLFPPKPQPQTAQSFAGASKPSFIARAQETKKEGIKEAQDNKEHGIKVASSMNGGIQLAIAAYNAFDGEEELRPTLEYLVSKYRKYILDNWNIPVELKQPF